MRYQLKASPIVAKTKGEISRLRRSGYVPVSIQHKGEPTLHLMEETRPLQEFIHQHGESSLIELVIEPGNEKHTVMVHSVQRDAISQRVTQVVYQKIELTDEIHTQISIRFTGEPEQLRQGLATIQHPIETVEIHCQQGYLPEAFIIDVSGLVIGDIIRVADIPHDSHVTFTTPGDTVIATLKHNAGATTEAAEAVKPAEVAA